MSQSAGADGRILWQHALPAGARTPWTYLSTVARRARMPHVQYWARVRDGQDCPLRRGAWYRVVELTPVEAIVDVNHRLLHIPRAFVQVLPPLALLLHRIGDASLEPASLVLVARPLHRRQVALHVAILVAIDLLQPELILLPLAHQLLHPLLVRGLRGQLGVERLVELALPRADRLALFLEAPLRRVELARLIVAQPQRRAHVLGPALPHLRPQPPRFRPVGGWRRARVARHLCSERGREREHEHAREMFHHVSGSSDASSVRSSAGLKSSSPTSSHDTGSAAPGCSTLCNSSRSSATDRSPRSTVSTGAARPDGACRTARATTPAPATMTSAAAILSQTGEVHSHASRERGACRSSRSRATTAWAVRSTSTRSAARTPRRRATSRSPASSNVPSSFISSTPSVA